MALVVFEPTHKTAGVAVFVSGKQVAGEHVLPSMDPCLKPEGGLAFSFAAPYAPENTLLVVLGRSPTLGGFGASGTRLCAPTTTAYDNVPLPRTTRM